MKIEKSRAMSAHCDNGSTGDAQENVVEQAARHFAMLNSHKPPAIHIILFPPSGVIGHQTSKHA